jgi:ubiquinone/menaquinone biosynthesis C-methylase UbiE
MKPWLNWQPGGSRSPSECCTRVRLKLMSKSNSSANGRWGSKLTPEVDWHARYSQQARWTAQVRQYLFERTRFANAQNVLEVGCGTGALLSGLPASASTRIFGLDLNLAATKQARLHAPIAGISCGDGHRLPYPGGAFDMAFCHFLLLWVQSPQDILKEMKRVVQPGGAVLALAEPDYTGRIDYPAELEPLGRWQAESLRKQGADPDAGRKLRHWFVSAGITPVESGIMAGGWSDSPTHEERALEWAVIESDLADQIHGQNIQYMRQLDEAAWDRRERVLFVPTFYTWGRT